MKKLIGRNFAVLAGLVLPACGTHDWSEEPEDVEEAFGEVTQAMQRDDSSGEDIHEITIATETPNAECTLYAPTTTKTMRIWADDVGIVHLWAAKSPASESFLVECDESGLTAKYVFDRSDPSTFQPAEPRLDADE